MPFDFAPTAIPEVILVKPRVFPDPRGFFLETYQEESFHAGGITSRFVQDNHSKSEQGVLRGLHFQLTRPQAKLMRVIQGSIYDVAVDIRKNSPTFGRWVGAHLCAESHHQLFIPRGFAHGFEVLSPTAEVLYKADDFYAPEDESGILWNDPELMIDWKTASPILSPKDETLLPLQEMPDSGLPVYAPTGN